MPRRAARTQAAIPWALSLATIATFLPEELSFYIFGLRLTVVRLIFILLAPVLFVRLVQRMAEDRYRFVLSDLFVPLAGVWMIYAPANIDGLVEALQHAGPTTLEFCVAYLATRTLLSEHGQALAFANLLCVIIAVIALLALLDPLTNQYFIHDLAGQLTGYPRHERPLYDDNVHRLGLLRASGVMEHSILFGFTCAIGFLVASTVPIRSQVLVAFGCGLGAVAALSSAPLQGAIIGFGLIAYGRALGQISHKWVVLIGLGLTGIVAIFLFTSDPFGIMIRHLIYDPESGYYRYWTWTSVIAAVSPSSWFGIGFGPYPDDFDINHSIDSLWLVMAIQSGIPGAVLVALSMIGAATFPTEGPPVGLTAAESRLGTTLGIVIFLTIFLAFTVHFWGIAWILTGLLIGARAHLGELGRLSLKARSDARLAPRRAVLKARSQSVTAR
jgi:hypothetical protein